MRLLLTSLILSASAGCSLLTTDYVECSDNTACRDRFGLGFICNQDGFCEESQAPARCTSRESLPVDLFTSAATAKNTIVFGSLMNRSIVTHVARENAARLALSLANDSGGLEDGRRFGMVFCTVEENPQYDNFSDEEAALVMGRYLGEVLGVPAIFGPPASNMAQSVFQDLVQARENEVLVISPSATSPALTALDPAQVSDESPGLLWRTAFPDSLQGRVIAEDMRFGDDRRVGGGRTVEVTNVAIIFEGGAYGDGLAQVFREAFVGYGGPPPIAQRYTNDGQRAEAIAAVGMSTAEEVLFISSSPEEVVAFLTVAQSAASGFATKQIFLPDSGANPDVLNAIRIELRPRIRGTRAAPLTPASSVYGAFAAAYLGEYQTDPGQYSFTAQSYDAGWLLAYGAAWAQVREGAVNARNIAKGLRHVSNGGLIQILASTYNTVKQRFNTGLAIDVTGASGNLDFDPITEETSGAIEIWRIGVSGQIEGIEVFEP